MLADAVDHVLEDVLAQTRAPGAAIAIVIGDELRFSRGYGIRAVGEEGQVTAATRYPIASTSKAINATILGMLADEGRLDWDAKVRSYLPAFRFADPVATEFATVRDLVLMRTGLPRHDWVWKGYPTTRADLASRLAWLEPTREFRERFQYNNLTTTLAGHVAETLCGEPWEQLVKTRIFLPLKMEASSVARPRNEDVTGCHHETPGREIVTTRLLSTGAAAPSGGAIWSTVEDMAQWIAFNLGDGLADGKRLIASDTLAEIHTPQIVMGADATAPSPTATYALGWCVDHYGGRKRVSHGGYLHDVSSDVTLFPDDGLGIVSFINFGCALPARVINERVVDALLGRTPPRTLADHLHSYEAKVRERARCNRLEEAEQDIGQAQLGRHSGRYHHPGYGELDIRMDDRGEGLELRRGDLCERLEHWRGDAWRFVCAGRYPIHMAHPFERSSTVSFSGDAAGVIDAVSIRLEPTLPPIRFAREA